MRFLVFCLCLSIVLCKSNRFDKCYRFEAPPLGAGSSLDEWIHNSIAQLSYQYYADQSRNITTFDFMYDRGVNRYYDSSTYLQ